MYIYHTTHAHSFILCYIIYVYIIYLHTFFQVSFAQALYFLNESLLHNTTIFICQNCIYIFITPNEVTICYPINVHLITICCIYILHVFKHNVLGLRLTLYLHLTLSMLNYIHYRTNLKHAFYFNKTNTIKTKKIIKISNSKYNFFYFSKSKKIFNFILLYWGNFISRTLPLYMFHFIFKNFPYFWGL